MTTATTPVTNPTTTPELLTTRFEDTGTTIYHFLPILFRPQIEAKKQEFAELWKPVKGHAQKLVKRALRAGHYQGSPELEAAKKKVDVILEEARGPIRDFVFSHSCRFLVDLYIKQYANKGPEDHDAMVTWSELELKTTNRPGQCWVYYHLRDMRVPLARIADLFSAYPTQSNGVRKALLKMADRQDDWDSLDRCKSASRLDKFWIFERPDARDRVLLHLKDEHRHRVWATLAEIPLNNPLENLQYGSLVQFYQECPDRALYLRFAEALLPRLMRTIASLPSNAHDERRMAMQNALLTMDQLPDLVVNATKAIRTWERDHQVPEGIRNLARRMGVRS